ncbi:MAG: radical SAM protein [Candidatus Cloacimonetes bacterium]|nr:radical SAM protein [Candidatus Cloacimonadota bacterium]
MFSNLVTKISKAFKDPDSAKDSIQYELNVGSQTSNSRMMLCLCPSWGVEMPPIVLGTLKTAMQQHGIEITTRDLNVECFHLLQEPKFWDKSSIHYWVNPKLFAENIYPLLNDILERFSDDLAYGPEKVIGFSILSSNLNFTNHLIERIKLKVPEKIIVVGGPCLCFKEERERLRSDIDYFVVGEGEESLKELLCYLDGSGLDLPESVYQTKELGFDLPFRMSEDLSRYGVPDYSDLTLKNYEMKSLPMIFTRSCLFNCRFCADYKSMGKFRKLTYERIFEIWDEFYSQGFRNFWLNDLLINGIMKELVEVCLKFEGLNRKISWIALATPNLQLKTSDLEVLARNGLKTLNFGVESGSNDVMRMMKKGFNREQAENGLRRVVEAGINTQLNIIVGFPGETEQHFLETLEFLDKNRESICGFTSVNACVLMAGSEISRTPEKYNIQWDEGTDMQTDWYIGTENTPHIRRDRLQRVLKWIEDNGYNLYSSNEATN